MLLQTTPNYSDWLKPLGDFFQNLGWAKALTILLFLGGAWVIRYLLLAVVKAKDEEIARLRADNDNYRQIYLARLDEIQNHRPNPPSPTQRSPQPKKR